MIKNFNSNGKEYTFYYMPHPTEPAGVLTFTDEEEERVSAWYPYIKAGDFIMDIGASFLSYTLPALAIGATVYSFSPEHEFTHIPKSIGLNYGFKKRSKLFNFGFYSKKGHFKTDTMDFIEEGKASPTIINQIKQSQVAGWYIPVTTVDEFVKEHDEITKIDFIKLDTEGAELEILYGAEKTLKKYKPKILIEYHLFKKDCGGLRTYGDEFLIDKLGYKHQAVMEIKRSDLPHILYTH